MLKIGIAGPISTEGISPYLKGSVSHLPPGQYGAPFLSTLVGALLERGYTVSVYTTSPGLNLSPKTEVLAESDNLRVHYCPVRARAFRPHGGRMGRAFDLFRLERQALKNAMLRDRPSLIHAHWSYEFALAAIESRIPHVVTCHDAPQIVLRHSPDLYRLVRYAMARRSLRRARFLTAVSPYLRQVLQPYAHAPIEVVPNPLPTYPRDSSAGERQFDPAKPRLAMVLNGWTALKNPQPALLAFARLRTIIPGATMSLFGTDYGPNDKASRWLQARGLTAGIRFVGAIPHPDLLVQLSGHDILLHPSLLESCPMGIAEAMMLGLPVVGGRTSGGTSWVIGNGGVTTDVASPDAIVSSLQKIVSDPLMYREYSTNSIVRAAEFSTDHVVDSYESIYRTVLQSSNNSLDDLSDSVDQARSH